MSNKKITESYVNSPWGKIAIVSWGNPENPPILLLHGYMDTAATFTFLVEKLPFKYYYVGIDMPGHGKSDPFPQGLLISKLHVVEAIRTVVEHMKWKTFTFLSHSMSCIIGILYNTFYPGSIEKMIFLDPKPALAWYLVIHHRTALWYKVIYNDYYDNYQKLHFSKPKSQTRESWINAVARSRNLTKKQSETVLSRCFIPTGNETYKLSWEQRVKYLAHVGIPTETLHSIMTNLPPTLVINASDYIEFVKIAGAKDFAENLLNNCEQNMPHFRTFSVTGGHDVHITNPELMVEYIENFLELAEKFLRKSKL